MSKKDGTQPHQEVPANWPSFITHPHKIREIIKGFEAEKDTTVQKRGFARCASLLLKELSHPDVTMLDLSTLNAAKETIVSLYEKSGKCMRGEKRDRGIHARLSVACQRFRKSAMSNQV